MNNEDQEMIKEQLGQKGTKELLDDRRVPSPATEPSRPSISRFSRMKKVALVVSSVSVVCVTFWFALKILYRRQHPDFYAMQDMGKTLENAWQASCDEKLYTVAMDIVDIKRPFNIEEATVFDLEINPSRISDAPPQEGTTPLPPEQEEARQEVIHTINKYNKVLRNCLSHQQWKQLQDIRRRYRTEWLFVDPGKPHGLSPSDIRRWNGVHLHGLLDDVHDDRQRGLSQVELDRIYRRTFEEFDDILASPAGADVNLPTPLLHSMVADGGFPPYQIDKLIKSGADVNLAYNKTTPLLAAINGAHECRAEVVELLLRHGAKPNVFDRFNNSPLQLAILRDDTAAVSLLVEHGADVKYIKPTVEGWPHDGWTTLHYAVKTGNPDIVRILVEHGADRATKDAGGKTPRDRAIKWGRISILPLL